MMKFPHDTHHPLIHSTSMTGVLRPELDKRQTNMAPQTSNIIQPMAGDSALYHLRMLLAAHNKISKLKTAKQQGPLLAYASANSQEC